MSEATLNVIIGGAVSAFVTFLVQIFHLILQRQERKRQLAMRLWEKRAGTYERFFNLLNMERFIRAASENADDLIPYFKELLENLGSDLGTQTVFASREFNGGVSNLAKLIKPVAIGGGASFSDTAAMDAFLKDFAKETAKLRELARKEFKSDAAVSYL